MDSGLDLDLRDLIAIKRDGGALDAAALDRFVQVAATGRASEPQLAAMLMAIFCRGLSTEERTRYALAMMRSGEVLSWPTLPGPTVDKHSTGGVGDKVSLVWAPMMAALGCYVPMISGRGLGHTGGTLDKLEAIPGFRTDLGAAAMERVLLDAGCVITGQTARLVPADRVLYDLRSRTATVPTLDHIAPSIMSKKLAEGAGVLVLDVKVGRAAFMQERADAEALARVMVDIGEGAGRRTVALLTDMDHPLGQAAGNAIEVVESLHTLRGGGSPAFVALCVELAAEALVLAGRARDLLEGRTLAARTLRDGSALRHWERMVAAQGGDLAAFAARYGDDGLKGLHVVEVLAENDGVVCDIDAMAVGLAVLAVGGGRGPSGEPPSHEAGVWIDAERGTSVRRGAVLARIFAAAPPSSAAVAHLRGAFVLGAVAPPVVPTALQRIGVAG